MNSISAAEESQYELDYSSEYDPPPPYVYFPGHIGSPLFRFPPQVNAILAGKTPYCYLHSCENVYRLMKTAQRHRSKLASLPSIKKSLKNTFSPRLELRVVGRMSLPAAVIHNIVTPPYHLTKMAIAIFQGRFERKRAENDILDEIMESLFLSLEAILILVTRLGLETHEVVERKLFNGRGYMYLALARLLEAYGSRFAPSGTVYLAAQKRLPKEHCSGLARLHFDQIHNLKENLMFVGLVPVGNFSNDSMVFERWICRVLPALEESFIDTNKDFFSAHILQKLRHIRDEMPRLVLMRHKI